VAVRTGFPQVGWRTSQCGAAPVGRGTAQLGFGATISAARARWPACDGAVTRIVLGPGGVPLHHGRTLRLVPPPVRRAAEVRDGGCVFTGCAAPTWWCAVHHLLAWIDGGATDLADAALLGERHHTTVHHGFRVERRPDGRWRTWRPDGTAIRTGPHRTGPGCTGPPLVSAA
jgi:hypothetical protein